MKVLFRFAVCTLACISAIAAAEEIILLDPSAARPIAIEVPLFGYKRFPEEIFAAQKSRYGLPAELIYVSASKIPAIEAAAAASGKDVFDLGAKEVVALVRAQQHVFASGQQAATSSPSTIVPWVGTAVDADFITDLVSSELVGRTIDIFDGEMTGDYIEMVSIDENVGRDFWNAYSNLENFNRYDLFQRLDQFQKIETTLDKYPLLLQAAKITFSPVSFGEIFVSSSAEREI